MADAAEPYSERLRLHDDERHLLEFERAHPRSGQAKDDAIRAELGLSPVRYYHRLARLRTDERAIAWDPMLMGRLSRAHAERTAQRRERRVSTARSLHRKRID